MGSAIEPENLRAVPRLASEMDCFVPGEAVTLALTFEIDKGWHLYWNGQNGEGMAPEFTITLPAGFSAERAMWPPPHRLVEPGDVLSHVYEDRLTILIPVRAPKSAAAGTEAKVTAAISWVVCGKVCVPESSSASLVLPVRDKGVGTADSNLIGAARAAMAKPIAEAAGKVQARVHDGRLIIESPGARRLAFYPGADCVVIPGLVEEGESGTARLSIGLETGGAGNVSGIIRVEQHGETAARHYTIELPAQAVPAGERAK
ncbi:hypothetical protein PHYC_00432 [Phycisphaerales bacterium]|nr:hypothetical protein PHYC_00432 [Phycisphaerales bacterium]